MADFSRRVDELGGFAKRDSHFRIRCTRLLPGVSGAASKAACNCASRLKMRSRRDI
jgi:hypothetical protein